MPNRLADWAVTCISLASCWCREARPNSFYMQWNEISRPKKKKFNNISYAGLSMVNLVVKGPMKDYMTLPIIVGW